MLITLRHVYIRYVNKQTLVSGTDINTEYLILNSEYFSVHMNLEFIV